MPRAYEMSWDPRFRRWNKMYRGGRYHVTCRQLNAPETKEGSREAANAWWLRKRAEIDGRAPERRYGLHEQVIQILEGRIAWAERHAPDLVPKLREEAEGLRRRQPKDIDWEELEPYTREPYEDLDAAIWDDRLERSGMGAAVPVEKTVGGRVDAWIARQKSRVEAGDLSHSERVVREFALGHFRDWLGKETPVESIDPGRWDGYYGWLLEQVGKDRWSKTTAKKNYIVARSFLEYLVGLGAVPALPNLHSKEHKFVIQPTAVETFSKDEIKALLERAVGPIRLFVYLALNCGFTQVDIADLHPSEMDWGKGTITRKRSKTERHEGVPTVTYQLWPETRGLLESLRSTDPERVLVTKSGKPWVDRAGKTVDNVRVAFLRLGDGCTPRVEKSFKYLRKTGASLLEGHAVYGRVSALYLGHSPRSIKDKHYTKPPQGLLDEALEWLRGELGIAAAVANKLS